ncbi:hypothetical protein [Allocoleopsis sp.]
MVIQSITAIAQQKGFPSVAAGKPVALWCTRRSKPYGQCENSFIVLR